MQNEHDQLTQLVLSLFRVSQAVSADGDCLAARHGLTSAKWKVLGAIALSGNPLSAAAIGRAMGMSRQATIKQIDLLITQGLIVRTPDPADARAPLHVLNAKGKKAYKAITADWRQRSAELSRTLNANAIENARELLEALMSSLASSALCFANTSRSPNHRGRS